MNPNRRAQAVGIAGAVFVAGLVAVARPVAAASPAVARDDAFEVVVDRSGSVPVMANDTPGAGGPFDAGARVRTASGTTAAGGSYSCSDGATSCSYTPPTGFVGTDSFPYTIGFPLSGGTYSIGPGATVTLTLVPNDPPVTLDDTDATRGSAPVLTSVLMNDDDPNRAAIGEMLTVVAATTSSAHGGSVQCGVNAADCIYRAAAGFAGIDTYSYTATDSSGLTAVGTVTIDVAPNAAPTAHADSGIVLLAAYPGGVVPSFPLSLLANDTDPDDAVLVYAPGTAATAAGGTFTNGRYHPPVGYSGPDSFVYVVDDQHGGESSATASLTVVLDAAPVVVADAATVRGVDSVTVAVLANDSDDADALYISDADATSVHGGTVSCVNLPQPLCTYHSPAGFVGADTFTYAASDRYQAAIATVTIAVTANAAPVVGSSATVHVNYPDKTFGVLTGFTAIDPDGDVLTIANATSAAGATVSCAPGALTPGGVAAPNCVYYAPATGFFGPDSVTLVASDGLGATTTTTVMLTFAVDQPIDAPDIDVSTAVDTPLMIEIVPVDDEFPGYNPGFGQLSSDTVEGGTVDCTSGEFAGTAPGSSSYRCTYTPYAGFEGVDSFEYMFFDAWSSDIGTATITVVAPGTVGAYGIASSDVDGDGATPLDPIESVVRLGATGGIVDMVERPTQTTAPAGYGLLGFEVVISAPAQTAADPLQLGVIIDASALPSGLAPAALTLFRDGSPVSSCSGPDGVASPDPCLSSVVVRPDGDVELLAFSSTASVWSVGAALPTVSFAQPAGVDEGGVVALGASVGGPAPFTYAWRPAGSLTNPAAPGPMFTGIDDGVVAVQLTVSNGIGSASASSTVTVRNVAPHVTLAHPAPGAIAGRPLSLTATFTDAGAADTHTASIEWGDGSTTPVTATAGAVGPNGHTYAAPGSYVVTLRVTDDDGGVGTATTTVNVAAPSNGAAVTVSVDDARVIEGTGRPSQLAFTVRLSRPSPRRLAVGYATAGGTARPFWDYRPAAGTLTFLPGQTTKTVTVAVWGDHLDELDEDLALRLSLVRSGLEPNATHDLAATGTIVDDDRPRVVLGPIIGREGNRGTKAMTYRVRITPSAQPVTVSYATRNATALAGSDYQATTGTLTFLPGQTIKEIKLVIVDDRQRERIEWFSLSVTSAEAQVVGAATITVFDDD